MAYKTKFLHFKTKASYDQERNKTTAGTEARKIFDAYISFIDENKMVCTWGNEYKCDISADEVKALVEAEKAIPGVVTPKADAATGSVGTSTKYAREDHIHPKGLATAADKLTTSRSITLSGAVVGSGVFDGSANLTISSTLSNFDASKITSGTIDIARLPAGALERLFVVSTESAAMSTTVQEGDVVQVTGNDNKMYFCISNTATTFATKFKEFTAGSATSVPWSGVTGKPTFATVATSGSYNDLTNKPTIPSLSGYATQSWVQNQGYLTSIPAASATSLGGIKTNYTNTGKNYKVQLDSSNNAYVNVPWTDTNTTYTAGSGISISSTNVISSTYTLPLAASGTLGGIQIGFTGSGSSGNYYNTPVQLSSEKAYVQITKDAITTALGYTPPTTNTTYSIATASTAGLVKPISIITKPSLNAATTTSRRYYSVQMSSDGNMFVNVPWISSSYTLPTATSSVLGGVKIGNNITVSSGTISLTSSNVISALGYTPADSNNIPEIPIALPNPYNLTINGISYNGSSTQNITVARVLTTSTLSTATVAAGYSYNNTVARTVSSLSGFSASNPDTVIVSTAKITFTASNTIKMDGLEDLSGLYYIYCLSYMANNKVAINGAVYA